MSFLPTQPTRFFGREDDLLKLTTVLQDPSCRLVTLVGTGGIGKTRLAVEVGSRLKNTFPNGVYFINLASLSSPEFIASAIAKDLRISLFGLQDLDEQIINYLRHRETLLILDNFEHLLDGVGFLTRLLDNAPALKILITSREVLNMRQEWVWSVTGMQYPDHALVDDAAKYGAVALFLESAKRIRPDFRFEAEKAYIVRICQLVEGMPLAIELASSWLKALNCAEIAHEIAKNMSFLNTNLRDLPERHRSIRVVFDHSWRLLTEEEQLVFSRLSIFKGNFGRAAAEAISGASLMILSTLLDKSLVQRDTNGRYQLHTLLRQYGQDQLTSEEQALLTERFTRYYSEFLAQLEPEIFSGNQQEAFDKLDQELGNALSGWMSLVTRSNDLEFVRAATSTLAYFYEVYGLHGEGINSFEVVYQQIKSLECFPNQIILLTHLCWMYIGNARYKQAHEAFAELQTLYHAHPMEYPPGHGTNPDTLRTILTYFKGDFGRAIEEGEEAIQNSRRRGDTRSEIRTLQIVANILAALGEYQQSHDYAKSAYEMALVYGNRSYAANCITTMGTAISKAGDMEQALFYYQEAHRIRQSFNNPHAMGLTLLTLGIANYEMENYDAALPYFLESMEIYREINDIGRLAGTLHHIGEVYTMTSQYASARDAFQEALELALESNMPPHLLFILSSIGKWFAAVGQAETAANILHFVIAHPALLHFTREAVLKTLQQIPHFEPNKNLTLSGAVAFALQMMNAVDLPSPLPEVSEPMLDPLTERELEVLRFLADGLTNQEIAERLTVVLGTVKAHNHSIFSKLYVKNRVQAISRARELHLI
jgi:predicted ATPase/DNA-binding CsgD family transcriptional regulator